MAQPRYINFIYANFYDNIKLEKVLLAYSWRPKMIPFVTSIDWQRKKAGVGSKYGKSLTKSRVSNFEVWEWF